MQSPLILILCSDNLLQLSTSSAAKLPLDLTEVHSSNRSSFAHVFGWVSLLNHMGSLSRQKDVWATAVALLFCFILFCFQVSEQHPGDLSYRFWPPHSFSTLVSVWTMLTVIPHHCSYLDPHFPQSTWQTNCSAWENLFLKSFCSSLLVLEQVLLIVVIVQKMVGKLCDPMSNGPSSVRLLSAPGSVWWLDWRKRQLKIS